MKRFVFHWLDGSEIKVFADSFSEAADKAGIDEEILETLDYCKEETEVPISEKILLLEFEGRELEITNDLLIKNIRNSDLHIGSQYLCSINNIAITSITCTKIDTCSATFSLNPSVSITNKDVEFLAV